MPVVPKKELKEGGQPGPVGRIPISSSQPQSFIEIPTVRGNLFLSWVPKVHPARDTATRLIGKLSQVNLLHEFKPLSANELKIIALIRNTRNQLDSLQINSSFFSGREEIREAMWQKQKDIWQALLDGRHELVKGMSEGQILEYFDLTENKKVAAFFNHPAQADDLVKSERSTDKTLEHLNTEISRAKVIYNDCCDRGQTYPENAAYFRQKSQQIMGLIQSLNNRKNLVVISAIYREHLLKHGYYWSESLYEFTQAVIFSRYDAEGLKKIEKLNPRSDGEVEHLITMRENLLKIKQELKVLLPIIENSAADIIQKYNVSAAVLVLNVKTGINNVNQLLDKVDARFSCLSAVEFSEIVGSKYQQMQKALGIDLHPPKFITRNLSCLNGSLLNSPYANLNANTTLVAQYQPKLCKHAVQPPGLTFRSKVTQMPTYQFFKCGFRPGFNAVDHRKAVKSNVYRVSY